MSLWPEDRRVTACHAGMDGECFWGECPQLRDGEPLATGRHCPLDKVPPECPDCGEPFNDEDEIRRHRRLWHAQVEQIKGDLL